MIRLVITFILLARLCSAQEFVDGWVLPHHGDTLHGVLLKHKKKSEEATRKYSEVQFRDSSGEAKTFYPEQLRAYQKQNELFRAINASDLKLFSLVIADGEVLLTKSFSPALEGCKYFFRKKSEAHYSAIDCTLKVEVDDADNQEAMRQASAMQGIAVFRILTSEASYRDFFMSYFKDCPMIVKKLRTGFITSSDTEDMFKEYNSCNRK